MSRGEEEKQDGWGTPEQRQQALYLYDLLREQWPSSYRARWDDHSESVQQGYIQVARKFTEHLCQTEWDRMKTGVETGEPGWPMSGEDWGTLQERLFAQKVYQCINYPDDPKSADIVWPRVGKNIQLCFIKAGRLILAYIDRYPLMVVMRGEKGPEKAADVLDSLEERVQKVEGEQETNQERLVRMEAYLTKDRQHLLAQIATLKRVISQLA